MDATAHRRRDVEALPFPREVVVAAAAAAAVEALIRRLSLSSLHWWA